MSTIDSFISSIKAAYVQNATVNYTDVQNIINNNMDTLKRNSNNLDTVLQALPAPEFTLAHLAALHTIAQSPQITNMDKFLADIETFLQQCHDKQLNFATEFYTDLCHFYTNKLCELGKAKRGVAVLLAAIKKLHKSVNQLTSVHADVLQLCLEAKYLTPALGLVHNDILDIHKEAGSFDAKHYLAYFYYAGCVYAALKMLDNALFHFEQAITIPCQAVISQIMIESYKKFIILSLISKGKLLPLPKYTSRIVVNQIKPLCNAYHEVANAFTSFDLRKLNECIAKYSDLFTQDRNNGLIKQLVSAFYKKNIQKLTKTFITLSLSDMATRVQLRSAKEAEIYVLNMIMDGEIFATINQKDGMVSFHDNPEKFDSPAMAQALADEMFACVQLDKKIGEMDREITLHPHYIQKCMSSCGDDSVDQIVASNR